MKAARAASLALSVFLALTIAVPSATWADEEDKVKLRGVVVSVDPGGSFQIQELGGGGRRWVILFRRDTEVEVDDDDDKKIRRLVVGDVVEVKGRMHDGRTILAKKVKILALSGNRVPSVIVQPPQAPAPVPAPAPAPANPPNTLLAIIKTLGIGVAVRAFAPALNNFINTLLQNRGAAVQAQTKVVPILSISIGISTPGSAYVGAAQVSGPLAALAKVQAVAVIEADYQQAFRVKALVPVDNLQPWVAFRRVPGVGVSAIIDLRI